MAACITAIQSPCIGLCRLNEQDMCVGCYRSIDEISCWSQASDVCKLQILENVENRKRDSVCLGTKSILD